MKTFEYIITDELGIHARPAGALVKEAKKFESRITIQKGDKEVEATKLMALMGLGVKCGDQIMIKVEGADEDAAIGQMEAFIKNNL
ncbi:MAG: HPr family phosphocarrier protein [Lachnospiraceae bacterium]|nr:HPr family phosphocarrier protein [Lachnospiraceae bacterium]